MSKVLSFKVMDGAADTVGLGCRSYDGPAISKSSAEKSGFPSES